MSRDAISRQQFGPRTGEVRGDHVGIQVTRVDPAHHYLSSLSVAPKYRGQGIGTEFMHGLLREHDIAGSRLTLHVVKPELAPWYGSMGFETEGQDDYGMRMTRRPHEP